MCPTVADPLQADTTEIAALQFADGVGDACDPRPVGGGDVLVALHTFATPATASWVGAGWTITDDRARTGRAARWVQTTARGGGTVALRLDVATIGWLGTEGAVGVALDGDGLQSGLVCEIAGDGTGRLDYVVAREITGLTSRQSLGSRLSADTRVVITAVRYVDTRDRGQLRCSVEYDGARTQAQLETSDTVIVGSYGFAADAAMVDVTAMSVYASPRSCMRAAGRPACPI